MLCQNSICCVFNRVKHSLRRRTLYPTELQKHLLYQVYIHFCFLSNKKRVLEVGFEKTFYHTAKSVDIFEKSDTITTEYPWGYGSVGRAMRSQRIGQGFESPYLHHRNRKLHACGFFVTKMPAGGLRAEGWLDVLRRAIRRFF